MAICSRLFFSLIVGIISGLIALVSLEIIHFMFNYVESGNLISSFYVNEISEEVIKISFIFFVINLLGLSKKKWPEGILNAFLVGFGFGLFEIMLILLSNGLTEFFSLFLVLAIHSLTASILGIAVLTWKFYKSFFAFVIFCIIAIIIHIIYNLFALNFY